MSTTGHSITELARDEQFQTVYNTPSQYILKIVSNDCVFNQDPISLGLVEEKVDVSRKARRREDERLAAEAKRREDERLIAEAKRREDERLIAEGQAPRGRAADSRGQAPRGRAADSRGQAREDERLIAEAKRREDERLIAEEAKHREDERLIAEAKHREDQRLIAEEAERREDERPIAEAKRREDERLAAEEAKRREDERLAAEDETTPSQGSYSHLAAKTFQVLGEFALNALAQYLEPGSPGHTRSANRDVRVRGYKRKDGTHVQPHTQTAAQPCRETVARECGRASRGDRRDLVGAPRGSRTGRGVLIARQSPNSAGRYCGARTLP